MVQTLVQPFLEVKAQHQCAMPRFLVLQTLNTNNYRQKITRSAELSLIMEDRHANVRRSARSVRHSTPISVEDHQAVGVFEVVHACLLKKAITFAFYTDATRTLARCPLPPGRWRFTLQVTGVTDPVSYRSYESFKRRQGAGSRGRFRLTTRSFHSRETRGNQQNKE